VVTPLEPSYSPETLFPPTCPRLNSTFTLVPTADPPGNLLAISQMVVLLYVIRITRSWADDQKPNNGETPVWEPFLMVYNNQLICYYSDQRDPKHGQKLVHQISTDFKSWGSIIDDEANPTYSARPGMPVISKMSNGQYFYTYENGGAPEGDFAVYFKISSNPLSFGSVTGKPLKTTDGYVPTSSPFNIYTSAGGSSGTLVVSANSDSDLFINHNYGQGAWTRLSSQGGNGYSRSLAVGYNPKDILIVNGGRLGQGSTNKVTASARDVNGCSTC
jgi:hypothetical protein